MKSFPLFRSTVCVLVSFVFFFCNHVMAQPVKLTPDEIFDWAERQYSSLFPRGSQTLTIQDGGDTIYYRHYKTTDNYVGIRGEEILGMGTFTGGPLTQLGTVSDIQCQALPGSCASGVLGNKRYIHWEEIETPTRNCAIRQFEGSVYCGANMFNGTDWTAIDSAPPVLSYGATRLPYYQLSSTSTERVYKETKGGSTLRHFSDGRFGWNGGMTAVSARAGNQYFQITTDGGVTWSNLTSYRIGPDIPGGGTRVVEGLAYAFGTIFAVIRQPSIQIGVSDRRYLLISPNGGNTWFESDQIGRVSDWYIIGATSGYIATDEGTFSLRFANGIILDRMPFDGDATGAVTQLLPVGPTGDTLFAHESFVGLWLLDGEAGKFYRPNPEWGSVSYFNYLDFGINGYIAVGRGSTSYFTTFPLIKKESPQ